MGRMDRALKRCAKRTVKAAGEQVAFIRRDGTSLPCVWAHITRDVEYTEGETQTAYFRDEVEMLVDEVCKLQGDDRLITQSGDSWIVDKPLQNDDYSCKAVIYLES